MLSLIVRIVDRILFPPVEPVPPPTPEELLREHYANIDYTRKARRFEPCVNCGHSDYIARGRTEIVVRRKHYYARQWFDCVWCSTRQHLGRRMDEEWWTRANPATMPFMVDYL